MLYLVGLLAGLAGAVMLIPQARETAWALIGRVAERGASAWEEGKKAKRRREHQLEEAVLGAGDSNLEEREAPDYIV